MTRPPTAVRYALALITVPLVGAATAAGHAYGGPALALVAFLATIILCVLAVLPWGSKR